MEANGLRNRLVHRYNQTDDLIAFVSIKVAEDRRICGCD